MKTAYHFVGATLRDGRPIPPDGETLVHPGELVMCKTGLHASSHPFDAIQYAPGATLCKVQVFGKILESGDKLCAQKRRIVARFDATELLRKFARLQALSVIDNWDAPDVVRQYLTTGDESLRSAAEGAALDAASSAAWSAAEIAARSAASNAAESAAESAARSAAWSAARNAASSAADSAARYATRSAALSATRSAARRAARSAAWNAASSAARYAASSATRYATWSAARYAAESAAESAARKQFSAMVKAEFKRVQS